MNKDPHIANIFSAEEEDCLSLEQLTAYQEAKLQGQEKHLVERHLLNCELCAITYESMLENGAETIATGAEEVSELAWDRLQHQEKKKRRGAIFWIVAAASIALLVTVGFFALDGPSDDRMDFAAQEGIQSTAPLEPDSETKSKIAMARESNNDSEDAPAAPEDAASRGMEESISESQMGPAPTKKSLSGQPDNVKPVMVNPTKDAIKSGGDGGKNSMKGAPTPNAAPEIPPKFATESKKPVTTVTASDEYFSGTREREQPKTETMEEKAAYGGVFADKKGSTKSKDLKKEDEMATAGDTYDGEAAMDDFDGSEDISLADVVVTESRDRQDAAKENAPRSKALEKNSAPTPSAPVGRNATPSSANHYADGIAAYEQGHYREAADNLRKATEATPGNMQAHLFAADAYLRISQPKAALFHIERILASPGNTAVEDAEWYKALAYLQLKEARKAQKQLDVVIARNGKHKAKAEEALNALK